jgi:hypothetical protein
MLLFCAISSVVECIPPNEVKMKKIVLLVSLIAILSAGSLRAQAPNDTPTVVRLDPALDSLVSADAKLELVKNDFGFTEGIVWVSEAKSSYLLLSDMYANVIYKLTPEGKFPCIWTTAVIQDTTSGASACRSRMGIAEMFSS